MKYRDYARPATLEAAWQLNQKKSNRIIGGGLWMRMASYTFGTAIDLSGLGLDKIEVNNNEISIGCMVTLHDIEKSEVLNTLWDGAAHDAVCSIVGVQFRNGATVGGSIFGRFGFSDVLTLFMALDAEVELYKAGRVKICEFAEGIWKNDILVKVHVPNRHVNIKYLSQRNSKTDFPVLACAVAENDGKVCAVIGARPMRAIKIEMPEGMEDAAFPEYVRANAVFGTNMRASGEYRKIIAGVLVKRGLEAIRRAAK